MAATPAATTTTRQDVYTDKAAAPLQHVFSQAIVTGKKIYCSGSIGLDKETGKLVEGGIQAETVCLSTFLISGHASAHNGLGGIDTRA